MREVTKGVFHTPAMIGRPVWYGRKVGIVRGVGDYKLFVQFGKRMPLGLGAHELYIACKNWNDTVCRPCKGHVEPQYDTDMCEKCGEEYAAAMRRRDIDY